MMAIKTRPVVEPSSSENSCTDVYSVFPVEMIFKSSFLSPADHKRHSSLCYNQTFSVTQQIIILQLFN